MIRVIIFLMGVTIIALICCLFAFWRTFKEFRKISIYNTEKLLKSTEKIIDAIEKMSKDINNTERKLKDIGK